MPQLGAEQCDQIGLLLATPFISKVAQMFGYFLGSCENHRVLKSNWLGYFLGNHLEKLGLLFISASGHTGDKCSHKLPNKYPQQFYINWCFSK